MSDIIKEYLEEYGIQEGFIDPTVNLKLSTGNELLTMDEYYFGNFITRLLKRVHLVDDFRLPGIACARFLPAMRRLSIEFNPFLLWQNVLRSVASDAQVKDAEILYIDKIMLESFKKGGWTNKTFGEWKNFLKDQAKHSSRRSFGSNNNDEFKVKSCIQSIYIHELLHCMWEHVFAKRFSSKSNDKEGNNRLIDMNSLENIAQDFAINQTLSFGCMDQIFMTARNKTLLDTFQKGGAPIKPRKDGSDIKKKDIQASDFEEHFYNQPFEYYFDILLKNTEEELKKLVQSTGLGKKTIYGLFSHEGGEAQQFEDFNSMSTDAKRVAKNDIKRVVDEMLEKGEIENVNQLSDQHPFKINNFFTKLIEGLYKTKTISWEYILRHYVRKAMGATQSNYTMKRESRAVPDFFPGHERQEDIDLNIVVDVSGSINMEDFNRFMNEIEAIASTIDVPLVRYMQFHHEIAIDTIVPLQKIRHMGIKSTGGTALKPVFEKLANDKNKTLTVVFTDGYIDDGYTADDYHYPILIFASSSCRDYIVDGLRQRKFKVVFQDGDNTWFS